MVENNLEMYNCQASSRDGIRFSLQREITPLLKCEPHGLRFKKPIKLTLRTCFVAPKSRKVCTMVSIYDTIVGIDNTVFEY